MAGKVETLDLLDFCKRAIWEWQACTELSAIGQLVAVDEDAPFPPPRNPFPPKDPGFPLAKDRASAPLGWMGCGKDAVVPSGYRGDNSYSPKVQRRVRASDMRVLQLTTVDLVGINYGKIYSPESPAPTEEELRDFDWSKMQSLEIQSREPELKREIMGIRKFGQVPSWMTASKDPYTSFGDWKKEEDFPLKEETKEFLDNITKVWTPTKKAEIYWISKLQHCQGKVLSAILASVPTLQKQGYSQWVLPNGRKVPLDSLAIIEFGIIPKTVTLTRIEHVDTKFRGVIPGEGKYKTILEIDEDQSRYWKIGTKAYDEGRGVFTFRHYALTTTVDMDPRSGLQAREFYVVDPTVRQWGGQGPLILCGEMSQFVAKFPGEILSADLMPDQQTELFSTRRLVDYLSSNMLKYLKTPICNFCGEVDKYEPDSQHFTDLFTYAFDNCTLLKCTGCKEVSYCGKFCQTMDWKVHKKTCGNNKP